MTRLARFSLAWIVLGGIPRTIWYGEFEWANAAGRGQVAALVVKHVIAFAFIGRRSAVGEAPAARRGDPGARGLGPAYQATFE